MAKGKIGIIGIMVLAILGEVVMTFSEPAKLGQVVYITRSKACGCAAETIKLVDKAVIKYLPAPGKPC